ncbi:MAG: right-handed parallel beta-helix repeat-containing protein [Acidobacteria bacterium]|nr:right-handed parallel beta-helix repeat-containing protein [Acidobacteriota bacterium]
MRFRNNVAGSENCGEGGVSLSNFFGDLELGGTLDQEKNVVAGNFGNGLTVTNEAGELRIINTFIGVNKFEQPLGNSLNGVQVFGGGQTTIGGAGGNERNIISNNTKAGIAAIAGNDFTVRSLEIIGNSIFANGELGIDLMRVDTPIPYPNDGVNTNDCYDGDDGANSLQNYPTLIAPIFTAANVTVQGVLRSTPRGTFRVDFYSNNQTDSSNYGEGEIFLGSETVTTDGNGFVSLFFISDGPVPSSHLITATATNSDGETSEFSCAAGVCTAAANLEELIDSLGVVCAVPLVVTTTSDLPDGNANDDLCDIDTSNTNPNECSLRAAIEFAITRETSVVLIEFDIPGEGVKVIRPASALPTVTKKLHLDGQSQPGYAGGPLIEIRGDLVDGNANGLTFSGAGSGSVVDALAINSFLGAGIEFNGDNGLVKNSFIGLYADGLTFDPARRQAIGISLRNSKIVTIGDEDEPNVISGNQEGIRISGGSSNRAVSNFIGVDKDIDKIFVGEDFQYGNFTGIRIIGSNSNIIGRRLVPNYVSSNRDTGIEIAGNSNAVEGVNLGIDETSLRLPNGQFGIDVISGNTNVIGGTREGAGNVISAHDVTGDSTGIQIRNTAGIGTLIVGNQIGLNRSGNSARPNNFGIRNYARGTLIGNVAAVNNIVSKIAGILLSGENSSISGTELRYNLIGTNTTREPFDLGEATPTGIDLRGNGTGVTIVNNLVAYNRYGIYLKGNGFTIGEDTGRREFPAISKNDIFGQRESGIWVDATSSGNTIANNLIGTLDNLRERYRNRYGIRLQGSNNNVVQNIISGNTDVGIFIEKGEADPVEQNNRIENNRIGTDEAGTGGAPNNIGVFLANGARANEVFKNLISGNDTGIRLSLTEPGLQAVSGNFIYSNKIGTNKDATAGIGNRIGIVIADGAVGNTIGGSPGIQVGFGSGNVISGNTEIGVKIAKLSNLDIPAPTQNVLVRNRIGVGPRPDASATSQQILLIPNGIGIHVGNGANNNTIGGALGNFTSSNDDGNIVSANLNLGIAVCPILTGVVCPPAPGATVPIRNKITGNLVGLSDWGENLDRILLAPNRTGGILVQDSSENFVGQQDSGGERFGNVVVANNGNGIGIEGTIPVPTQSTTRRNQVVRNFVGVTPTGQSLGNTGNGIYVFNTISTRIISNDLLNNVNSGIFFRNNFTASFARNSTAPGGNQNDPAIIVGNNIGVMRDDSGALVVGGNQQNGIRLEDISDVSVGLADVNEPRNVIAANGGDGIVVKGAGSNNIVIKNNSVGTDADGTPGIGNGSNGIFVTDGAGTILIGGPEENSGNVITASVGAGVRIDETAGTGILVDPNVISGNGGLGIDLNLLGLSLNDAGDSDGGANKGQNYPEISGLSINGSGDLVIQYEVDSSPANSNYGANGLYVEFFIADGSGEGAEFIGSDRYTTADHNGSLAGTKTVNLGNALLLGFETGDHVTSTATDADNNTSEFTPVLAPTAAGVEVSGKVMTNDGRPISSSLITLTDDRGNTVSTRSNQFGRYGFDDVEVGRTYVLAITSRRFVFENPSRIIQVDDNLTDADFTGIPQ